MANVVKHDEVRRVVVDKPETFDLIGLSKSQAGLLAYVMGYLTMSNDTEVMKDISVIYNALSRGGVANEDEFIGGKTQYVEKAS